MEIKYLKLNQTYTSPTKIKPRYIVVHSTAVGLTNRMTLFNAWNNPSVKLSCHGMVDDKGCTLTLPPDYKGWHVGSRGNDLSIGFEICEPPFIAYLDAAHTKVDTSKYNPKDPKVRADFEKRWKNAVKMAAYLCSETGIDPKYVLCHAEMFVIERATNHGDVVHWFNLFGERYYMDYFRAQVKRELEKQAQAGKTKPKTIRRTVRRHMDVKQ